MRLTRLWCVGALLVGSLAWNVHQYRTGSRLAHELKLARLGAGVIVDAVSRDGGETWMVKTVNAQGRGRMEIARSLASYAKNQEIACFLDAFPKVIR